MLIQNYGLYWNRDDVFWGRGSARGTLLGQYARGKEWVVNFRGQKGIYCLYDSNFNLVYVGQAGSGDTGLYKRLRAHRKDHLSARWTRFSWFGTLGLIWNKKEKAYCLNETSEKKPIEMSTVLNHIEAVLIHASEPPLNRKGGSFGDAEQYLQRRHEDKLYPPAEEMVRDLWENT